MAGLGRSLRLRRRSLDWALKDAGGTRNAQRITRAVLLVGLKPGSPGLRSRNVDFYKVF